MPLDFIADYWIVLVGVGAFVVGKVLGLGSSGASGDAGSWFDGEGDCGD